MLQRNDSGYAESITAPGTRFAVVVQPGQIADLPTLLFGWASVGSGTPVVTVPTPDPPPVGPTPLAYATTAYVDAAVAEPLTAATIVLAANYH